MFPPPILPDDLDVDAPPGSILIDPHGYISDRTNATTATGVTRGGKTVMVTFWAAQPPRGSCFTLHCPDMNPAHMRMPQILNTVDDLSLIRIPVCSEGCGICRSPHHDYFVYHAGSTGSNKPPSLDLIPLPPGGVNPSWGFGILPCPARDMYFVATLSWAYHPGRYHLRLYSSKTGTWTIESMWSQQKLPSTYADRVIAIGGDRGSLGWVDLWKGILICDILLMDTTREVRHMQLPSPLVTNNLVGSPFYYRDKPSPVVTNNLVGFPFCYRDITVLGGYIKYFEMNLFADGWVGVKWRRKDSWKKWKDCVIKVYNEDDPGHTQLMPPDLQEAEAERRPVLKGRWAGYPALSSQDDDVVYISDRYGGRDRTTSVIAVDLRKQTVRDVAKFGSERQLGYSYIYIGSGISKHLPPTRGKFSETSKNEIVQAVKHDVPGKILQSEPTSKVDGTSPK